jgi:hypothetical protein
MYGKLEKIEVEGVVLVSQMRFESDLFPTYRSGMLLLIEHA